MESMLSKWLYSGEAEALKELAEFGMDARQRMAAEAQELRQLAGAAEQPGHQQMKPSTTPRRISVTRDDIQSGQPGEGGCCAVALAVQRHMRTRNVHVGMEHGIRVRARYYRTPLKVQHFIAKFDDTDTDADRKKLKPFSFTLKPMEPTP